LTRRFRLVFSNALILDLEESVQPHGQKQVAREMIATRVGDGMFPTSRDLPQAQRSRKW
jgi:hypothetical protein